MYSFETVLEGIKYTVYFFGGFTGIIQPFTPENPITSEEIYKHVVRQNGTVYVQGWYTESKNGPRLDILKKVFLVAEPFELAHLPSKLPGTYYHRLVKGSSGVVGVGEQISALDSVHEKHFLRHVVDKDGELESALHIYNNAWDIYYYKYNEAGGMVDKQIEIKDAPEQIPDL